MTTEEILENERMRMMYDRAAVAAAAAALVVSTIDMSLG